MDYWLNRSYIVNALCENRETPQMNCKGKCFLVKQLKNQEKQEQQSPDLKREKFEVQPFYLPASLDLTIFQFSVNAEYKNFDDTLTATFSRSVFHPPTT